MNLTNLSNQELELLTIVEASKGTMEEIERQIKQKGVITQYKGIYQNYYNIVTQGTAFEAQVEALKRMIFINWYSQVEPSCYTGISELDETIMRNSYLELNSLIKKGQLDGEFTWMLSFYCSWDFVLFPFIDNSLQELKQFMQSVNNTLLHVPERKLAKGTMANRGQMGVYWKLMRVENV